ncbi:hypothetical protein [Halosimplex sp. TS25]|uniref:DUF7555 family protein n=1 Tax=Halosimplex rarum TaxID=3396619 RepID=UPI0039EA4573
MASNRLRLVEFVLWVVAVSAGVSAAAIAVGFVVGGTLVASKYAVFFVGILLFGLGSLGIQPTPSYRDEKRLSMESTHEHGFEARIQEIPPLRGHGIPFDQRVGRNKKVFAASLLVLGVSLAMEFWLGIRV